MPRTLCAERRFPIRHLGQYRLQDPCRLRANRHRSCIDADPPHLHPGDNTSVDPARSLGVAWFAGPEALGQVRLFLVAPLIGTAIAGFSYKFLFPNTKDVVLER